MKAIISADPKGGYRVAVLDGGRKVNGLWWNSRDNCATWASIVHPRIEIEVAGQGAAAPKSKAA